MTTFPSSSNLNIVVASDFTWPSNLSILLFRISLTNDVTFHNQQQEKERRNSHVHNIHVVNPDIKVHTVISAELDFNHAASMMIPLGECRWDIVTYDTRVSLAYNSIWIILFACQLNADSSSTYIVSRSNYDSTPEAEKSYQCITHFTSFGY